LLVTTTFQFVVVYCRFNCILSENGAMDFNRR